MNADYVVWVVCCVMITFYIGFEVGAQNKPLLCPEVRGQQVVSTIAPDTCIYVQNNYGRSLRKVKVKS